MTRTANRINPRIVTTLRTQGLGGTETIMIDSLDCRCGDIRHGVSMEVPGLEGGFVVDPDDIVKLADLIRATR